MDLKSVIKVLSNELTEDEMIECIKLGLIEKQNNKNDNSLNRFRFLRAISELTEAEELNESLKL